MQIPEHVARRAAEFSTPGDGGCLISNYSTASHGYAQIGWHDKSKSKMVGTTAHRAAMVFYTGEQIPDGFTVDHLCKVRPCVAREHLRILSNYENARRTFGRDWPLGQCINGHPNSELYRTGGRWRCHPCHKEIWTRGNLKRRKGVLT